MKILCVGDVVGSAGCNMLKAKLPTTSPTHKIFML